MNKPPLPRIQRRPAVTSVPERHLATTDRWVFDPFGPMRRDDPLYRMPSWFVIKHAGIHTALARRAVDEAIAACETKLILPDSVQLIDRPATLEAIARAEAAARSARAFVTDEIARVWDCCVHEGDLTPESIAPLRLALVNASSVAVEVARSMSDLLTTTAIAADSIFARLAGDATVANTHVVTSHRNWAPLGARLARRPIAGPTVFI